MPAKTDVGRSARRWCRFIAGHRFFLYDAELDEFYVVDRTAYDVADSVLRPGPLVPETRRRCSAARIARAQRELHQAFPPLPALTLRFRRPDTRRNIIRALRNDCLHLILETTRSCNLRCRYCCYSGLDTHQRTRSGRQMSLGVAQAAVRFYFEHSRRNRRPSIGFYGGEPLLNLNLIEAVVAYARERADGRRVSFHITTNGTLLMGQAVDFLLRNRFHVTVSLDGPASEHDRYRVFPNDRGTHALVLKNLACLRERDPEFYRKQVRLSAVLAPPISYRRLDRFFSRPEFRDLGQRTSGVDDPGGRFRRQVNPDDEAGPGFDWLRSEYVRLIARGERPNQFLRAFYDRDVALVHRRKSGEQLPNVMYPNGICVPGLMRLFVDATGVLHACERVNHHMPLGTVQDGFDFDRIIGYIDQYRALSEDDCSRCWAVRYCRLCFKSALGRRLSLRRKRNECRLFRRYWLGIFALYWSIQGRNPQALKYFESVKLN